MNVSRNRRVLSGRAGACHGARSSFFFFSSVDQYTHVGLEGSFKVTAMVDRIRSILARFPENETAVRNLIRENSAFDALCQAYMDTDRELEKFANAKVEITDRVRVLLNRRTAIEVEILTVIEGYTPV